MVEHKLHNYMSIASEYYDLREANAQIDELNFYLDYALSSNGPILEPMCGSGNYLIPLLEKGFSIEGVDASPQMLAILKSKCSEKNLCPIVHEGFIQEMNFGKVFNLIIIPNWSFGLITGDEQIKKTLSILYQHLNTKGKLVFSIATTASVPSLLNIWYGDNVDTNTENSILLSRLPRYDESTKILTILNRYERVQDHRVIETEIEVMRFRLYAQDELTELLKAAGFEIIKEFHLAEQYGSNTGNCTIIYECQKL